MIRVTSVSVGALQTNCYFVTDEETTETLIVDPGDSGDFILSKLNSLGYKPSAIVATHGHFDHILGAFEIQISTNLPFLIRQEDEFLVRNMQSSAQYFLGLTRADPPPEITGNIRDGETLKFGNSSVTVLATPGHTPGSVILYDRSDFILSGDTVFAGGDVGRTDFKYSDRQELERSVKNILSLPPDLIIYPGHGEITTVADEVRIREKAGL